MTDLDEFRRDAEIQETAPTTEPEVDSATLNTDQHTALTLLQEICAATGQDVRPILRHIQGLYLNFELTGGDVPATWGRMGQSLDALQFLINTIVSRRVGGDVRVLLDADGYRERRAEALRRRAVELASEVKKRNEEAELEPLPAHERRIIHSALADDPDVSTYSEGDEPARRVVISPRR
jgi:spoIIIJ-associated protein